jgi:hypothetical protein
LEELELSDLLPFLSDVDVLFSEYHSEREGGVRAHNLSLESPKSKG